MKLLSTALAGTLALVSTPAIAKSVDIVFVIDQSGSMANEFRDLGTNLGIVFNGLEAAPEVDSVGAGLITYEGSLSRADAITLQQDITTDASTLESAFAGVSTRGGTENALTAVDAAIPGGAGFVGVGYRPDTVRSIVLITDEDADDENSYQFSGLTGYAALGGYLDQAGYLNNVITSRSLFDDFAPAARPAGDADGSSPALFDLAAFNADPQDFLRGFVATKLEEIIVTDPIEPTDPLPPTTPTPTDPGPAPIPLPASALLLGAAMLGLGAAGRRREA